MVNKFMFYNIMSQPTIKNVPLIVALDMMCKYSKNIHLLTNEKHEVFYRVNVDEIMNLDIESGDFLTLNQSGWVLDKNKKYVEYFI